jgi:predicted ferric reductase
MGINLTFLLSIIFFGYNPRNGRQYESIGVRAGYMTLTQLPLVFLMAGKANIVGRLTGTSYERLNWLHRCVARTMFITAMIHMCYYLRSWARYDYIQRKFEIDIHSRRGLGAFCTLAWLVVSSLSPIRGWKYEVFVIQHMISAIGFLVIVWYHVPPDAKIYVWFPVGLWAADRVVRWAFMAYHNLTLFHRKPKTADSTRPSSVFACKAVFHQLSERATRITIQNPPMTWKPGQHAFLSVHSLAPFQAHPFTISSIPSDGYVEFVVRAHRGCTNTIHDHTLCLPPQSSETKTVFLDGPYGRLRPLEQFDTVILLAGSTGATFTVPLLRDLLRRHAEALPTVTRKIRFVWVVKSRGQVQWFSKTLGAALDAVTSNVVVEASIYVTCDSELTAEIEGKSEKSKPDVEDADEQKAAETRVEAVDDTTCGPDGACCCRAVIENEDAIETVECCCSGNPEDKELSRSNTSNTRCSSASSVHRDLQLPDDVHFVSGRPSVKNLILKELEQARGESAVVVCGPHGLAQVTRMATVELSDERAVHKGTGAQGVCSFFPPALWDGRG